MHGRTRGIIVGLTVLAVLGLAVGAVGSAVAAAHHDEPTFLVDVDADGDATITIALTYDLEDENEQEAFETLREDGDARENFRDQFESRMGGLATDAAAETDRGMSISGAELDLYTAEDDVGVAELSVRWHGLGAVEEDSVTVTEPFAGGFTPDQQFVLVGPETHESTTVTPDASDPDDGTLVWDAGSDLAGFEVTFTAGDDASDGDTSTDDVPGFGVALGLIALVVVALRAARRSVT